MCNAPALTDLTDWTDLTDGCAETGPMTREEKPR